MDTEMFQVFGLDNSIEVIEVQEIPQRPKPTVQTEKPVRVLTEPITGRGGYRPGNGRKTNEFREKVRENLEGDGEVDYAVARAKKESWLAKTVELDYRIKQGEYVARDVVRGECAKAFSAVAQTLRSLPDALERREGISPALAEKISQYLDDAMNTLCEDFKRLAGDA
jgi:hypothetical protein